ncbi:glycoside hydrolase family 55 protein [Zasmidium cellare ATCC 36951]|uniref:Glycoside hydrolase family 55 protein n=1 Tax=Zasmidium cellare ATCC 36951 TaxID=1080233 RepID=A0A6A6CBM4_ZASCE|nr:glycoside hydrolase family 55 protein [Zasmidium cellare ATCC 36951]KAF2164431.1 glycoside hydrolase family 55 protein [Zasmidium cellare ATCC 36951]
MTTLRTSLTVASFIAALVFLSLLSASHADPGVAHVEDSFNIPLSPHELKVDLDDAGIPHVGPNLERFERNEKRASYGSGQPYWVEQIPRRGKPAYGRNDSYVMFRNVLKYGADPTGTVDSTEAIQRAIAEGNRCGYYTGGYEGGQQMYDYDLDDGTFYYGCDSQTTTPAIIYIPYGVYLISKPVIMYYYTAVVGDANNLPVLKATPDFSGIGMLDTNPYVIYNNQWYQNQNNFWRQVRNLVLDTTDVPKSVEMHALHWQIAQTTHLQNIVFNMPIYTDEDPNAHVGIFMENGSGLWIEDLIFNGGYHAFFAGNQQINVRNLTFNDCHTGIFQNWGWIWSYKSLTFNRCVVGFNMSQGGAVPTVGQMAIHDSDWNDCQYGVMTGFSGVSTPVGAGQLTLGNCNFANTNPAVAAPNGTLIIEGNQRIDNYVQGTTYVISDQAGAIEVNGRECYGPHAEYARVQQLWTAPPISRSLLDSNGKFVERKKPQYEGEPWENFVSIIDYGCPADGVTDATECVQSFLDSLQFPKIGFVDHGAYVITSTVTIPNNIRLVGELWPLFMVYGDNFQNMDEPVVAFRVGQPGDVGTTEISEILFQTRGPTPGAIIMEWNLACTAPATCGAWDTHFRIGGTNGTLLQNYNCKKRPNIAHGADRPECFCAFLILHVTTTAKNVLFSNQWLWVSDHELDLDGKDQIDIYNARGLLIETHGPIWFYGSSSEHSMLYNYQIANAKDVYLSMMQSETAYMQSNPNAISAFPPKPGPPWNDPDFSECFSRGCFKTIAVRIFNSSYIFSYGAGLYSFFENYDTGCIMTNNCDERRIKIDQSQGIYVRGLANIAAQYMVQVDDLNLAPYVENESTDIFDNVAIIEYP